MKAKWEPATPIDAAALLAIYATLGDVVNARIPTWTDNPWLILAAQLALLITIIGIMIYAGRVWWRAYRTWQAGR